MSIASPQAVNASTVAPPTKDVDGTQFEELRNARLLIAKQDEPAALLRVEGVINYFETKYGSAKKLKFSARTVTEALYYMTLAAQQHKEAQVYSAAWATAYDMKGYILQDLGRRPEAKIALQHALRLAPQNSQILSELANVDENDKSWDEALRHFTDAEKATEFSPPQLKNVELGRALRGQGYVLVELHRLDEAAAKYRRCLEIDPNDQAATRELQYVIGLGQKQATNL
ncbi:tetratricopeptide repeat protein [Dyella nitratireducens]|uniref:Tetratricopeptide repeat protein n=1 Tax=Dyella nitratireducens TaxID=1849580 RepID=A0ABQ1GS87_9GAMM|nr:tetratricopeptide repeat protein [Dyella nitratireducens]GGA48618.1 hypothetical protein GCM10010981_42350 [Dyella nitratireducens]GLQ42288.1 hypothetical protein GCM10007902_21380 [Dyella nitratireducens]